MSWKPSEGVRRLATFISCLGAVVWTIVFAYLAREAVRENQGNPFFSLNWGLTALAWLAGLVSVVVVLQALTKGLAWVLDGFRGGRDA